MQYIFLFFLLTIFSFAKTLLKRYNGHITKRTEERIIMDMTFISSNDEVPLKTIPKEEISEFRFKQYLSKDCQIALFTEFQIGDCNIPFGQLTIEQASNLREENDTFFAELLFDYHEYLSFKGLGKELNVNGRKILKLPVSIPIKNIIAAGVIPKS